MNKPLALLFLACLALSMPAARAELPDPARFSVMLELGDVKQARAWLDEGLDPNFEGHLIGTGLMIGAWEGNIPMMELFLERGADIHRTNRFGETALMLAAWKNRPAAMQWLLERGARPNRPDKEWTALHYAAFAGHATLVETLLKSGADVNARSTNGSTVIMMAAREGHAGIAGQLLAAGANPSLQNDFDDDAVTWAMRQGNFDIAKTFTSAENFAELARQAALFKTRVQRSIPVPDVIEEYLRMARFAEAQGKRPEAVEAYRKAFAALKAQEAPRKVGAGGTAKKTAAARTPSALVIRAKRGNPEQQSMSLSYSGTTPTQESASVDQLLEQARTAEATGNRAEALRLFRQASTQLKGSAP
jgi:tetratricopeptide (TPR) repeat protein